MPLYRVSWWDHDADDWQVAAEHMTARETVHCVHILERGGWDRAFSIAVERENDRESDKEAPVSLRPVGSL